MERLETSVVQYQYMLYHPIVGGTLVDYEETLTRRALFAIEGYCTKKQETSPPLTVSLGPIVIHVWLNRTVGIPSVEVVMQMLKCSPKDMECPEVHYFYYSV